MSASGTEAAEQCSGKVAMENEVVKTGQFFELPDKARDSGIKIHEALALSDDSKLSSDERATQKHCAELRDSVLLAWKAEAASNGDMETIIEKRFWYRRGLYPLFSGQPDYIKIDHPRARAIILDFKTGRTESEEASDNLQLRTEVVLLKHNFAGLEEISGAIIEPWVSWDSVRVRYLGDDLRQAENQIVAIADRTIWESNTRIAGRWCRYCKARTFCNESIAYIQGIQQFKREQGFYELPRGEAGTVMWERIKLAKKLLEDLEWSYHRILEVEPNALPGYCLPKRGKARRKVPYPRKLKESLSEYLSEDEIDGCAEFRLGKIQELLGIKHRIENLAELKRLFNQLIKDVIVTVYDIPAIRPLTRRERESISEHSAAKPSTA